ncbi:MAG: hypothetical protein U1E83_03595 [Methylotetracoccus sp.]
MKVVLFCGGFGNPLRECSDSVPKPLVQIGRRPILWHLMRYYAHYGHNDFVLCLGYLGDEVRDYFLRHSRDDWRLTFVDTGLYTNIGQRLLTVRRHLEDDEFFLANYSDNLSDLPHDIYLAEFVRRRCIASFIAVHPANGPQGYDGDWHGLIDSEHRMISDGEGLVTAIEPDDDMDFRVNGGFFCLHRRIFDYIQEGEDLVEQPFHRLIERRLLWAYRYDGFWEPLDTWHDKNVFDQLDDAGDCPWMTWRN